MQDGATLALGDADEGDVPLVELEAVFVYRSRGADHEIRNP